MKEVRTKWNGKLIVKRFKTDEDAALWLNDVRQLNSDPSLPGETWSPVKGFSRYEYSNFGRVRSMNYKMSGRIKILKPAAGPDGYLQTMFLRDDGKYISKKLHRVIMLSIEDLPGPGYEVNHKNGIKTDNRPINLEWMTRSQNCQHSFDTGLQKPKRGELNGMSKLTRDQVEFLRNEKKMKGRFWGRNEYALQFGVSAKHLQDVVNNPESWK